MRVLLCTNSRDRGSTSRSLEAWTRLLPNSGVTPHVTVGGEGPLLTALRASAVPVSIRPLQVVPSARTLVPFGLAVASMARVIRAADADLVHANEHEFHMIPAWAARLAGAPIVTHLRFKPTPEMCRWMLGGWRRPGRLFFTSRTQMQDSAEAVRPVVPEDRWRLVPNGLDFSTFGVARAHRDALRATWGVGPDTVVLGLTCAISPRKRIDHFLRLVARLRARGLDVRGIIAGHAHLPEDKPLVGVLQHTAVDLGLRDAVRFLGYVEPVEPLYAAFDLNLSTSAYETFGMSVIEAMACACPVLAYPGGAVAEVVGPAASVVPDGDEDALFDEALRLVTDPGHRRLLGEQGRAHAKANYDIRAIVPALVREYQAVVAQT